MIAKFPHQAIRLCTNALVIVTTIISQFNLGVFPATAQEEESLYLWHTFHGADETDWSDGGVKVAVDRDGNVYVLGASYYSWDGPNGELPLHDSSGADIVVMKLAGDGTYLWHTFYGTTGTDGPSDIAVDGDGNVYVVGFSSSGWNGPEGVIPLHSYSGGDHDILVFKLSSSGGYQWHTFYGSGYSDSGHGIALDSDGEVVVTGETSDTWNGPGGETPINPYGGEDPGLDSNLVVIKLDGSGNFLWHTFFGSATAWPVDEGVALDGDKNIYVTGNSYLSWNGTGDNAPLHPHSSDGSGHDIFALKLLTNGSYAWHTFYGSQYNDRAYSVAVDTEANLLITGTTEETWNGPGDTWPLNAHSGNADAVVLKLDNDGSYQWHTFYGTFGGGEQGEDIITSTNGYIYLTGSSSASWDGPSGEEPLNAFSGGTDAMIIKLDEAGTYQWHTFYGSSGPTDSDDTGAGIALDGDRAIYMVGSSGNTWNGPGGASPLHEFSGWGDILTLKMYASNESPVITEGAAASVLMSKDGAPTAFDLTLHATDADGDGLNWSIATDANHGAASASGSGDSKVIGYTPDTDYVGLDSFIVQVDDGLGGTDTIHVNVTVGPLLVVNTLEDADTSDGYCSLREAILAANADAAYNECAVADYGDETILFSVSGTIALGSTLPAIDSTLTIDGSGQNVVISGDSNGDGDGDVRVFEINTGTTAFLSNLTITKGYSSDEGGGAYNQGTLTVTNSVFASNSADYGGGIYSTGPLEVIDSTFSDNTSTYFGGGLDNFNTTTTLTGNTFSGNTAVMYGGGVANFGTLTVTNSTFSTNSADWGGGLYNSGGATMAVTNSTISGNSAVAGGGINNYNTATLNYTNTIIANSTSGGDCFGTGTIGTNTNNLVEDGTCSASLSGDPVLGALADNGGPTQTMALSVGSPALNAGDNTACPLTDQRGLARPQFGGCDIGAYEAGTAPIALTVNSLNAPGDGICNIFECTLEEAITLIGEDGIIDFDPSLSGGYIHPISTLEIIKALTIDGSALPSRITISGDTDDNGTNDIQVFNVHYGVNATLKNLIITKGHTSGYGGGGIFNNGTLTVLNSVITGNSASNGCGILNDGSLMVDYTTFSGNSSCNGGGIYNEGSLTLTNSTFAGNTSLGWGTGILNSGTAIVTNSTFSNNTAYMGGGIFNDNDSTLTITNSTFSGNSAGFGAGINNSGTLNYANTIIANATAGGDCFGSGMIGTNTNNLVEDGSCSASLSGDPLLGPLGDHGGSTQTFSLLAGSPALDAGDDATCAAPPVNNLDQRGVARPQGAHCDIGAFENDVLLFPVDFGKTAPVDAAASQPLDLNLSWDTSSGATSYEYCLDTVDNDACDTSWLTTGGGTSVNINGLASHANYSWQARACNENGCTEANGGDWWGFTSAFFYQSSAGSPHAHLYGLAVADLDGDGRADIVTGGSDSSLLAWHNDGSPFDGEWTSTLVGIVLDIAYGIAIADLDNDGYPDIVTGSGMIADYEIIAWHNDGTPFDGMWTSQNVGAAAETNLVALADLDNDSLVDIVSLGTGYGLDGEVRIWQNDGTPFSGLWSGQTLVTDSSLAGLEVADLDKDGFTDIIYTYHEYYPRILVNDGTPWNDTWVPNDVGYACPGMTTGLEVADLDGDGWLDLATTCGFNPAQPQYVWQNDGSPFSDGWTSNAFGTVKGANMAAADFNLDGDPDLVTDEDTTLAYWNNNGNPFSGGWGRTDLGSVDNNIHRLASADLDNDGDADIVSVTNSAGMGGELQVWQNLTRFSLRVRAFIDGDSRLVVQGDSLYWHHDGADAPGRTGGCNEPTYVNGMAWYPVWPDIPDAANRDCNCDSSDIDNLAYPLLAQGQTVNMNVLQARYQVNIIQQPTAENDYTLIVDFNDGPPGGADWYEIELTSYLRRPAIVAFPSQGDGTGSLGGDDWLRGLPVTLTINDPDSGPTVDYTDTQLPGDRPWNPDGTWITFDLFGAYTLVPGDVVTYSNSLISKTHIVTGLQVTDIDVDMDTVTGTDVPGMVYSVWVDDPAGWNDRDSVVGLDGNWSVDFSVPDEDSPAFDIVPGSTGQAKNYDADWDSTQISWRVLTPNFTVRANWEQVDAFEWPLGSTVTLEIDDLTTPANPDYTDTRTMEVADWDPNQTHAFFDLWGVYDIKPGFNVRVSDGVTEKTLTVSVLSFDTADVDVVADTVSGISSPNARVFVWACGAGVPEGHYRNVTADSAGNWTADFGHFGDEDDEQNTFDIRRGASINTNETEGDGDSTLFWQNVPNPQLSVRANNDQVEAYEWTLDSTITLEIDDPATPDDPDYSDTRIIGTADWDPSQTYAQFNLGGVFDIQPGFLVSIDDGTTEKTHTVSVLSFTDIDLEVDTVTGIASPNSRMDVWACPHGSGDCINRHVEADGSGNWLADFGHEGDEDDEQNTFDIKNGNGIDSQESDNDSDRTMYGVNIPNPQFSVRANIDQAEAYEWPLGNTVTLEINDPATPDDPDYTDTRLIGTADWDPSQTYAFYDLNGIFDIQPGFLVRMSDGETEKNLTVSPLAFTEFDLEANTVTGIASPEARVDVWACPHGSGDCINRHVEADGSGNWLADFGHEGDEDDEQNTFDIKNGNGIDSQEWDNDSDRTMYGVNIPNPQFSVRANNDQVEAYEWPLGNTVTLEINDPATPDDPDYTETRLIGTADWDPSQTYAYYDLNGIFDIQPGFLVRMSDGETEKNLTVSPLAFTEFDLEANTVTGIASPGARVDIWVCPPDKSGNCINRHVDADGDGNWLADFEHKGDESDEQEPFDITFGTWVDSQEKDDDSDRTMFGETIRNPHIEVEAWNNRVTGYEFAAGADVTVTVDDPVTPETPDYEATQTANGDGWVEFWPPLDIIPGFLITMTDGESDKALVVSVLHATAVEETDMVYGIASPNTDLWFWIEDFEPGDGIGQTVSAGAGGNWNIDLEGLYTLHTWNFGGVNETDPDGDATYHRWRVVHPTIEAWMNENTLKIWDWPLGEELTVTLDDPSTPLSPDYSNSVTTVANPWFEGAWAYVLLDNDIYLAPGLVVTVSGGGVTDSMVVSANQVTEVDFDNDRLSGVADPDTAVLVILDDGGDSRSLVSDGDGNWTADFSGSYDITVGTEVNIDVHDADWDATILVFYASAAALCTPGDVVTGYAFGLDGKEAGGVAIYFDDYDTDAQLYTARTASDGWYGCGNLPVGDYRIWVEGSSVNGVDYSRQYYDQTIYEAATRVEVVASTHLTDINFIYDTPTATYMHIDFNMSRPITGELAIRQAIAYGTDRQRINDAVAPGAPVMDSFIPQGAWAHATSDLPEYGYNQTLAATILTDAGWVDSDLDGVREKGGTRLHLDIYMRDESRRVEAAKILQENMAAIGMEIDILILPNWVEHLTSHDFDLIIFGWVGDENADFSEDGIWWVFKSDSANNHGLYDNSEVDTRLENIRPLRTRAEVLPLVTQIQVDVMTDLATLPLFSWAIPPIAEAGPDQHISEGDSTKLNGGDSTDPYNDLANYEWDADNDGQYDDATGVNPSIPFDDSGAYTVGLLVTDAYSMTDTDTVQVTVDNIVPTATFNAPTFVAQGNNLALSLTGPNDPSSIDTATGFQYAFDCGNGSGYSPLGSINSVNCPTDGLSGTVTVGGMIQDKDGGFSEYTRPVTIIAPPGNVAASDGMYSDKVKVTWDAVSGATVYKVYRAGSVGGIKTQISSTSSTQYNDTTAVTASTYYYWVITCIGSNCSGYSAHDSGWRGFVPLTNLQASDGTYTTKVQVTWDAVASATYYKVYSATTVSGPKTLLVSTGSTSFVDTSAAPGQKYYYWVTACAGSNCAGFVINDSGWRNFIPPTNVQASDGAYTSRVMVSWDAVGGASYFQVYRAMTSDGAKTLLITTGITTYADTSATPGQKYFYWVTACTGVNCSNYSAHDTGWRNFVAPSVQASDGTYTTKVQVTWDVVAGSTYYLVYRATTSDGIKTLLITTGITTYADTSATPGQKYFYWVTACTGVNCSNYSAYDTGWRNFVAPSVQASDGTYTTKVQVTWDVVADSTYYLVYRATTSDGIKTLLITTGFTTYVDTSAVPGQKYYYWVTACAGVNCSAYSAYDIGWRNFVPPTNVQASDGNYTTKVQVTWDVVAGSTYYLVYRATTSDGIKTLLVTTGFTTYVDTSAVPGQKYYYWVTACTGVNCSNYSAYDSGWRNLSTPTNVQASDGAFPEKVQVTWDAAEGATYYKVYRATSSSGTKTLLGDAGGTSYDDTTATPSATYYYWVKAGATMGLSAYSGYNTGWR